MKKTNLDDIKIEEPLAPGHTDGRKVQLGPGITGTFTGDPSTLPSNVRIPGKASYSQEGLAAYREEFARSQQELAISKIKQRYASFDNASRDAKIEAVKDLKNNPYLFKDPFDGLNSNLYRWTQQAPAFAGKTPAERDAIASEWYDKQIAPFYAAMKSDGPSKQQWMENAWTRAMKFDPSQSYHAPFIHGLINGFESGMHSLARSGQTGFSLLGVPLRTYSDAIKDKSLAPLAGWQNLALNILNRPKGESVLKTVLEYGREAPLLGTVATWDKEAADYFSFWHDITPNRSWTEKATSFIADNALQLPLFMGAGKATEMGLDLAGRIAAKGTTGFPVIGNLTRALDSSKVGKFAAKLLSLGTEGLAYGTATRDLEDKSGAWKDSLNFMVMGSLFSLVGKGGSKATATIVDHLPKGSPERIDLEGELKTSELAMSGKRLATPEEILIQHRQNIAGVAAAGGLGSVSAVFEEALHHTRMSEQEGWTPETWDAWKRQTANGDPARFNAVFAATELMRKWLKENNTSLRAIDEELAAGNTKTHDAFMSFLHGQVSQAMDEMGMHVGPISEAAAQERAESYVKSEQGQAEIKGLIGQGAKPEDAKKKVTEKAVKDQAGFVAKAEEARNVTGPANTAKRQRNIASEGIESLPDSIRGSKPRYSYGVGNNFELQFEDPRDLAAYVLSNKGKSAAHAEFLDYYKRQFPSMTPESLANHGQKIRDELKNLARGFRGTDRILKVKGLAGAASNLKSESVSKMNPAKHIPILKRIGRYTYDAKGKTVGYQMSTGFDWTVAKQKASETKGWKGKGNATDEFWQEFVSLHDGDNIDHDSFAQDLKEYFNPLKNKGIFFEKGSGDDHTNFFGFMYHFRNELPGPVADKLHEILLESPKMLRILNTKRIAEDQLEYFGQTIANHLDMFMRSKWYQDNGERNVFRSTKPSVHEITKWQVDLLKDMQKREVKAAPEYFPGNTKAARAAKKAYLDALAIVHKDETEAFLQSHPRDKEAPVRLAKSMDTAKTLQKRARAGTLSEGIIGKLQREHQELMTKLGKILNDDTPLKSEPQALGMRLLNIEPHPGGIDPQDIPKGHKAVRVHTSEGSMDLYAPSELSGQELENYAAKVIGQNKRAGVPNERIFRTIGRPSSHSSKPRTRGGS